MERNQNLWGGLSALALAAALGGCSFEGAVADGEGELGDQADALRLIPNPPSNWEFRSGEVETPNMTPTLDPAVCAGEASSMMIFSRDTNNVYRAFYTHRFAPGGGTGIWDVYGANLGTPKTFGSRPACVMRETTTGAHGFVLVGRGTDNKLYASMGYVDPASPGVPLKRPTAETGWVSIGETSNVQGGAALASNGSRIALVFNTSDNKLYARTRNLPYSQGSWTTKKASPALPAGATLLGTPAIAYVPSWPALLFQVVARMNVNGQIRLYETYFDGTNFVSVMGSGPGSWTQLPVNFRSVDSDPALEYTPALGYTTLYWRSGPEMMQTSGFVTSAQLGSLPERIMDPLNDPYFGVASPGSATGSGPSAVGGFQLEFGSHIAVARTTDNRLWHFESNGNDVLRP